MKIKTTPEKERAKSILRMIRKREKFVKNIKQSQFSTIIAENYYEIIKELCTAIALSNGYKFTSENAYKELIDFMRNYKINEHEIEIMQDLRIRRNKSSYEGQPIEKIYLDNKKEDLLIIIRRLKEALGEFL